MKKMPVLPIFLFAAITAVAAPAERPSKRSVARPADYSFGYLLNGFRRMPGDASPDILCFETAKYGFAIDAKKLSTPRFRSFDQALDYQQALEARTGRMDLLRDARLGIELEVAGKTYRAESANTRFSMWDSGRVAQYYTLLDLNFTDDAGKKLDVYGDLNLVAWPGSLSLTVDALAPQVRAGATHGRVGMGWNLTTTPLDIPHSPALEPEQLTLEMWVKPEKIGGRGWLICKNKNEWGKGNYGFTINGFHPTAIMNNSGEQGKETKLETRKVIMKPGSWYHLALTYDGKTMCLYVDGKEEGRKTIGMARQKGNGVLRIGQRADGNGGVFKGVYDQVRLWNRALGADEIKDHFEKPEFLSSRDGLVLDRNFDKEKVTEQADLRGAKLRLSLKTDSHHWQEEKVVKESWKPGEEKQITLNCNLEDLYDAGREITGSLTSTYKDQRFPVTFDPAMNCWFSPVRGLQRSFEGRYTKITDYDEFDLMLNCADPLPQPVPFLLYLKGPANITGFVPIVCKPDGTPTGIPVQLSKNWHNPTTGQYLRGYALIPVKQGRNHYRLRIPYGFYGSLPSASHAQLCILPGKGGGQQRWDQLALACGGESLCLDIDQSLSDMVMTDIRIPLGRFGKNGNPWGWSEGGWGGEWLGFFDGKSKRPMAGMKAAYMSQGPCLTDVRYSGAYGSDRAVLLDAKVEFPRSDDYARTFQKLTYRFQRELSAEGSYLHRLYPSVPDTLISYGNADGLLGEVRVEEDTETGTVVLSPTELTGPGPWWVAFPERDKSLYTGSWENGAWVGYPAIIIRDYDASFGGKPSKNIWLTATQSQTSWGAPGLDTRLVAGPDVKKYQPGDYVEMDLEWAHLVPIADNYGWTNQGYINALKENPNSWKIAHREAVGNDVDLEVEGGSVLQQMPVVIRADKPEVTVTIQGGVGHVPIRFEALATADNYAIYEVVDGKERKLDQSAHGNDFWQTDYDPGKETYKMTFNLPVDGKPSSKWMLAARRGKEIVPEGVITPEGVIPRRQPDTIWNYKTVNGKELRMFVFLPEGYDSSTKEFPVYIVFHGGSWNGGSPSWHYPDCLYWSKRGMVAAAVEYRLRDRDRVQVPLECVKDAKSAVRFLRKNAAELKVDTNRIVVAGGSAGGQMAAAVAMADDPGSNDNQDDLSVSCMPNAVLLHNPWFYVHQKELSPKDLVKAGLPPMVTFLGSEDPTPVEYLKEFHDDLKEAGTPSEFYVGKGGGHGFCTRQPFFYWALGLEDRFLVKHGILTERKPLPPPEGMKVLQPEVDYQSYGDELP